MTIVASVKVRDGLVLATDSMTTVSINTDAGPQFVKAYENARKLFQIRDLPIGAVTYGLGNIGSRSMEGLVLEACKHMPADINDVEEVAQQLFDFVEIAYTEQFDELPPDQQPPACGFLVAGYSSDEPFAQVFGFELPFSDVPIEIMERESFGASWRGVHNPFVRLWRGFDPGLTAALANEEGIDQTRVEELVAPYEIAVAYDGMPVQDAVNFATYILDTTIGFSRFAPGVAACGGPMQVAAILPDEGFRWIAKPALHIPPRP